MAAPESDLDVVVDAEQAVIGALLANNALLRHCGDLGAADFLCPDLAAIYGVIVDRVAQGRKTDFRTLLAATSEHPVLGDPEVRKLIARCLAACVTDVGYGAIEGYPRIVRAGADRRRLRAVLDEARGRLATVPLDPAALDGLAADVVGALTRAPGRSTLVSSDQVLEALGADLDAPATVHSTGLPQLDRMLGGGLYAGKVYGISARMKAGKTALMVTISYNLALAGVPHAYLCLEMTPKETAIRYAARHGGVPPRIFLDPAHRNPELAKPIAAAARAALGGRLQFMARPRMRLADVQSALARIALEGRAQAVFVDYLQLIGGRQRNTTTAEHLDEVAQTIAEAAKAHGLCLVVASQTNRDGEVRGGDGLLAACDVLLDLHRVAPEVRRDERTGDWIDCETGATLFPRPAGRRDYHGAWLEMRASRYTEASGLGGPGDPALRLCPFGPFFEERSAARGVP